MGLCGWHRGKLVALDAEIGTKKWDASVTGGFFVSSSPAVVDGTLYIGDGTEDVLSFNAITGAKTRTLFYPNFG
ncbi:PQQ-binding-like beta-propeller repeat protein [Spirosoma endbachense]|uniref:PQQ-binding-like beta-propeller repeat protein n=1 Tax=Spirosoma endbachense TaxID=2666025 RepID=A0A6P1W8S1_9BACT|nr:PQQ-binding-like beta-propeller repeat protein [Spirosoma endbachense]